MLIDYNTIQQCLINNNIYINGVLHIGAHECEEKTFYNNILNIHDDAIIWIDGNQSKVNKMKNNGIKHIYQSVLDETERDVIFNITNNTQASSILHLNHECGYYNDIHITEKISCKSETLNTFFKRIDKIPSNYNFWNLDIQGSELYVLRGAKDLLEDCLAIYTEVNSDEVYKGCGLISELDEFLSLYGFKRIITKWTDKKWGDALYLKIK
jgi:FkbM family methyltransferase